MAIIGSAEVEVRADVRRLGKDITDSLKGLEKQADQIGERLGKSMTDSLNNLDGLTLRVDIDQDHFRDQLVTIEGLLNDVSDKRVKVDVDTSELSTLNESVDRVVNSIPDIDIKPIVSSSSQREFMADVDSLLDRARAAAAAFDSDIPFNADIDQALNELERLKQEIEDLEDQDIELAMTLDQSDVEQINLTIEALRQYNQANDIELGVDVHIAKAMAQIALLTKDRRMNIFPQIGGKFVAESAKIFQGLTGINVMREDFRKFIDSLTQLDERLGPLAMQLTALSAAVPTAGALGGWAITLLGDLGSLSGLLIPLAGILGGATIGFGTLALALSGTGDRLKDLNPTFEKFRDTISNTYWGVAEKPFRDMVRKVLPPLQTELKTTATALGEMSESLFDAVVNIALSKDGAGAFSTVVGNTNTAIKRLGPAFEPFLNGLLTVTAVGSRKLPLISDWLVEIGEGFDKWATEASKPGGAMEVWMDDAIEVMKALFSILGSTVGIMKTLYNVAKTVGFPGVRELADGFERVNEALKQPGNIKYMEDLGRSVMTGFGSITDGLSWVGPLIQTHSGGINRTIETMGRIVGSVLTGIGNMLTKTGLVDAFFNLFDSLETAVTAFEPVWENLGNIFAVTIEALGRALEKLTPVFVEFFDNLENDANLVKPALMDVLDVVGEWGPGIMKIVGDVTGAIFEFLGGLSPYVLIAAAAFMALLPAIGTVIGAFSVVFSIIGSVIGAFSTGAGVLAVLSGAVTAAAAGTGTLATVIGVVTTVADGFIDRFWKIILALVDFGGAAKGVGGTVGGIFAQLRTNIATMFGKLGGMIAGWATAAWNLMVPKGGLIRGMFSTVLGDASYIAGAFGDAFEALRTRLGGLFSRIGGLFGGMVSRVGGLFSGLGTTISGFGTRIGTALQPLTRLLTPVVGFFTRIGTAIGGLIPSFAGLGGGVGRLGGSFGTLLGRVVGFVPIIGQIVSIFITAFAVSEDLRKAVGEFLVNAFITVAAVIKPVLAPLWELVTVVGEVLTEIGVKAAPIFTSFFGLLNSLMPILQLVGYVLGTVIGAAIRLVIGAVKAAWATIAPIFDGLVTVVTAIIDTVTGVVDAFVNFAKSLADGASFGEAFMTLLGDLGSTLLDGLVGIFEGIVETVIGVFDGLISGLGETAKGILDAILGVFESFDIFPQGQAILQSLIDGFTEKIGAIKDWLVDLTQKIIEWKGPPANDATLLKDAGASIIQSLIDGFISVVQNVFSFLQGLTQQIVDVVLNVISAVVGIFQTGWDILLSIVQTVWNGIVTVIQTVFQFIMTVVQAYINLVVTIFQTGWSILTTVVQTVWNFIVTIIQTVFTIIMTVVQTYINLVVTIFQTGWNILTTVVQTVWNFIVTIIQTVFTTIMTVIQTYITIVVTIFQTGWNILTTVIQAVWLGIQTVIQAAWTTIQIIIQTALTIVVTIFTTIWNTVLTVVMTVWTAISNAINIAITTVQTIISTVMTAIMLVITTIWNTIKTVTMTVWNGIKALIQLGLAAIKAIFTGNFAAFRTIITTAWNVIKSTTQAVWNAIKSAISSIINTIRSTIQSVFNSIRSTITSIMNGIRSTIQSVWNTIRSAVTSAVNSVRSAVTSAFNAVRSIITSVMNAARSIISSVWSSIRSTVSSAVNGVRSAVSSGFNALRGIVSSAWNAVVSAVRSSVSNMMGIVRGIPGQIKGALGNLGSLLTGAGRSIIQGLINGVTGMIGSLKSKFSSITSMIPDWKGPPDTDAKLLTNAGELIMEGLINGLESKYGAVKNSLQTFTGDLSQTVGTQIGADVGITTAVRNTALSDAERRLSYRSNAETMVQSRGEGEVHLHFYQPMANEDEIIMAVNRQLGRG